MNNGIKLTIILSLTALLFANFNADKNIDKICKDQVQYTYDRCVLELTR